MSWYAPLIAASSKGTDGGIVAACGPKGRQAWLCEQTYRITGSRDAAEVADALARPVRIVLVLVVAAVLSFIARRLIGRIVAHLRDDGTFSVLRRRVGAGRPSAGTALRRAQRAETVGSVLRNVAAVVIWTIALLMVLGEIGIDLAPLIAGAGIVGVALGFGAQQVVRDYLAGLFIVLEDQYGVGDVIEVNGATGTVEWVSLRITQLRDEKGVAWYVSNGEIKRVANFSQRPASSPELSSPPDVPQPEADQ